MLIKKAASDTWNWAKSDFHSYPLRFCIEIFAWTLSIGCTAAMTLTVPNPPLVYIYPFWILGCSLYSWAAWTRNSFGMLANYILLTTLDIIGLIRILSF